MHLTRFLYNRPQDFIKIMFVNPELRFSHTLLNSQNTTVAKISHLTSAEYVTRADLYIKMFENSQNLILGVTGRNTHTMTQRNLRTQLYTREKRQDGPTLVVLKTLQNAAKLHSPFNDMT